jgi:LysM repeat protein
VALPVPSPAPASPEVHPGEAEAAKNRDTGAKANETVSPPVGETGSISVAPQKTQAEEQTGAKNDGAGQLTGERAGQEAPAESGGPDEGARGSRADEEGALQAAEFFTVTVKKGESLNEIAVRWFPEDPESGKKAILSANPQIDDENLLLAGETLRIPGCGEGGSKDW